MPAPRTDIDEHGIAARVALSGIRPTARATGLPVATVQDIAKRLGVKVPSASVRLVPQSVQRAQIYSGAHTPSVQPAHAVITDEVTNNGARGRLAASRIAADTLEDIATAEPGNRLVLVDSALTAAKLAQTANVPHFERQQDRPTVGVVNIALLGQELPERIATARVVED